MAKPAAGQPEGKKVLPRRIAGIEAAGGLVFSAAVVGTKTLVGIVEVVSPSMK